VDRVFLGKVLIKQSSIEYLKSAIDIVDVIGSYIELKKTGSSYKARCPFHDEKTPSFVVSPAKGIFHCFGCGKGGDAISFVKEYEKLNYPQAIEKIARDYNITLEYEDDEDKTDDKVLEQFNNFFKKMLEQNSFAQEYLKQRGIFNSSIEKFEIGYAPSSKEQLEFMQKNFIDNNQALSFGIVSQDENARFYARFSQRVTFPIYNIWAKIVGFGGRTLSNHPAKYINSPQTKYFNKSRLLYGYHLAKQSIFQKKEIIVTEGYFDVIMLHQAGFENSVATLGTALTNDHLPLLKKGEPKVILAYDGDKAGISSALKASKLLLSHSFGGGVVIFEDGKDPADLVREKKINYLSSLFAKPKDFGEFVIENTISNYNLANPREKEKAFKEIYTFLNSLNEILKEHYKSYAAGILQINPNMFKFRNSFKTNEKTLNYDITEATILKAALQNQNHFQTLLDLDEKLFFYHKNLYQKIISAKHDEDVLQLEMNDDIKITNEENFEEKIKVLKIKSLQRELESIKKENIEYDKKIFLIKKIQQEINSLKKAIKG